MAHRRKETGDIAGAVKWLEEAAEVADAEAVFALGRQVAELAAGEGGDLSLAAKLYEKLLEKEPTVREAWQPLTNIYRQLGDLGRLERVVGETLDGLQQPTERNELRAELAGGLLNSEQRAAEAVWVLKDMLIDEPTHEWAQTQLVAYWESTGNNAELVELLRKQFEVAQQSEQPEAIKAAALRLGSKLEQESPDEVPPLYRSALAAVGDDVDLLNALLARLEGDEHLPERAELSERLLAVEPGEDAGASALQLAELYRSLDDDEAVGRTLELGYRLAPENPTIREQLEQRFRELGDFTGLAKMLVDAAESREDPEGKTAMLREAARLYRDQLGEAPRAAELLNQAHSLVPSNSEVVVELAATLAACGEAAMALEKLTVALEAAEADPDRLVLLQHRAHVQGQAGDEAAAFEDLEEAFVIDAHAVAPQLEAALEHRRQSAAEQADAETERTVTLRCVDVMRVQDKNDGALELLANWIERNPEDIEGLRKLQQLQTEAQRWQDVAATCGRLIQVETEQPQIDAVLAYQQACQMLGNPEHARAALEHVRTQQPDNGQVRTALRGLYEQIGAHAELARIFIEEANAVDEPEQKASFLRWAGQTLVVQGDLDAALPALQQVLELQPDDAGAIISLADAHILRNEFDEADGILDEALAKRKARRFAEEACPMYQRKSHIARGRGDGEQQLALLLKAHQTHNKNGEVAADLADLAEALEQWDVALKALRAISLIESGCRITPSQSLIRQGYIAIRGGDEKRAKMIARRLKRADDADSEEVQAFLREIGEG